jgi:hypothetical protein
MDITPISLSGTIHFKLRFNTTHGDTQLFWRVIIDETEYLVKTLNCMVHTRSDASYDTKAEAIKYHVTGTCQEFLIDNEGNAIFK